MAAAQSFHSRIGIIAMKTIVKILMERDGYTERQAREEIAVMMADFHERLETGEMPFDICEEYFGLEPDYLEELIL